jgi:hypothetical protein
MPPEPEPLGEPTIDAADLLQPEPPPRSCEASRSVTDLAIESARLLKLSPDVLALLLARREQGRAHYGTELQTANGRRAQRAALLLARREQGRAHYGTELQTANGRRAQRDQLQEAVDGLAYALQYLGEHPEEPARAAALDLVWMWRRTVDRLLQLVSP